jgi:hypothetical protein
MLSARWMLLKLEGKTKLKCHYTTAELIGFVFAFLYFQVPLITERFEDNSSEKPLGEKGSHTQ